MAQVARSQRVFHKAESAMISAMEVYNKPDFRYREETFAILATNAWELMLKARVLQLSGNDPKSIWLYERRRDRKGNPTRKLYKRKNRSGNTQTISLPQCILRLERAKSPVPEAVKKNLFALIEIRDNAVHYMNAGAYLSKQVLEVGTAAVKNFVTLAKSWFQHDLGKVNLYLMPLAFARPEKQSAIVVASADEKRVVDYLAGLMKEEPSGSDDDFQVGLTLDLRFRKVSAPDATNVVVSQDPAALKVSITEEDVRKRFPWDYSTLTKKCRDRYESFKVNGVYHAIRKLLAADDKLCRVRFLDPGNPRSAKKEFYSPTILQELDKFFPLASSA